MRRIGHPSARKLERWLAGDDLSLDRHLATCEYCADRLEPLLDESQGSIGAMLLQLLEVPEELPERLQVDIGERLGSRQDLAFIGEFFGLPFRTARVITSTDQGDN